MLKKLLYVLVALAVACAVVTSCAGSNYKVMSVKEGLRGFSFEYPEQYQLIRMNLENTSMAAYTTVGLSAMEGDNLSEIYVYIWIPGPDMSSADTIMDALLKSAQNSLKEYTFENNNAIMVGDTIARQAVFTADSALENPDGTPSVSRPATFRITTMIYSDVAVEIDMTCDLEITDSTTEQYQHLLDTFAVLS